MANKQRGRKSKSKGKRNKIPKPQMNKQLTPKHELQSIVDNTCNSDGELQLHHFLTLSKYECSEDKARDSVIKILVEDGNQIPDQGWDGSIIRLSNKQLGTTKEGCTKTTICSEDIAFDKLVEEYRHNGFIYRLIQPYDKNDEFFGGTFGIATPNPSICITMSYAGRSQTINGPSIIYEAEKVLMEDILFYRQESCKHSHDTSFVLTNRYFRAYLLSCISIIDAFINRHIIIGEHNGLNTVDFNSLKETNNLEQKIELWLQVFANTDITKINKSEVCWGHFQELRNARNNIVHVNEAFIGFSIEDIAKQLNYVRAGVGGFLKLLRQLQGKPSLIFIEKLRNAPKIEFIQSKIYA